MTPEQLHILQHSLGADKFGRNDARRRGGPFYRDWYCVGLDNTETLADLRFLVAQGWMHEGHKINEGRDQYFFVTQLGISAMLGASPQPPKLTRSQERYRKYLDADCGMDFGEWLKCKYYRLT